MWHCHFNTRAVKVFILYNYFYKLLYQIIVFYLWKGEKLNKNTLKQN